MLTPEQRDTIVQLVLNDPRLREFQKKHNKQVSFSLSDIWASRIDLVKDRITIGELVDDLIYVLKWSLEHEENGLNASIKFTNVRFAK